MPMQAAHPFGGPVPAPGFAGQNGQQNLFLNGMNQQHRFEANTGSLRLNGQNNKLHIGVNRGHLNIEGMNHYVVVDRNEGNITATGMNHFIQVVSESPSSRVHSMGMNIQIQQERGPTQIPPRNLHAEPNTRGHQPNENPNQGQGRHRPHPPNARGNGQRLHLGSPHGMIQGLFEGIFGSAGPFGLLGPQMRNRPPRTAQQPERTGQIHEDRIVSANGKNIPVEAIQGPNESCTFNCPICCEDADKTEEDVCVVECLHWYHFSCLGQWLKRTPECPTCRIEVSAVLKVTPRPTPNRTPS